MKELLEDFKTSQVLDEEEKHKDIMTIGLSKEKGEIRILGPSRLNKTIQRMAVRELDIIEDKLEEYKITCIYLLNGCHVGYRNHVN